MAANTAHNNNLSTDDWQVSVINKTASRTPHGRNVTVMIFQALPDCQVGKSISSAWFVVDIASPGRVGPIPFPKKVHFGALDAPDGVPRLAGPVHVEYGQNINVMHQDPQHAPQIEVNGEAEEASQDIKATSVSGNVGPLELALYKNDKKLVSFKYVNPNEEVCFNLEPALYIVDVKGIGEGHDFEPSSQELRATKIHLSNDRIDIKIEITQESNGQLKFSEIAP